MARTGPAPKPRHLKVLEGTFRADREADNALTPEPSDPNCPTWLGREAKAEWRRVVGYLGGLNALTEGDRVVLTAWVEAWETYYECYKKLKEDGRTFRSPKGHVCQRPEVAIMQKARTDLRLLAGELGLSPSARTKISSLRGEDGPKNPFAEFSE